MSGRLSITRVANGVALLVLVPAVVWLAAWVFRDPAFEVANRAAGPVEVSAHWLGKRRDLGIIAPGGRVSFTVDGEAAMRFVADLPDARRLESKPIYFTNGTRVLAIVNKDGIAVRYDRRH